MWPWKKKTSKNSTSSQPQSSATSNTDISLEQEALRLSKWLHGGKDAQLDASYKQWKKAGPAQSSAIESNICEETYKDRERILADIHPVHFEGEALTKVLTERKKTFTYPSYGTNRIDTPEQERNFDTIYRIYMYGRDLEAFQKPDLALDYYIYTLLEYVPLGCVYYERAAILLEKKHDFRSALAVCELAMQMQPFEDKRDRDAYAPEYAKRMARLRQRIARSEGNAVKKSAR